MSDWQKSIAIAAAILAGLAGVIALCVVTHGVVLIALAVALLLAIVAKLVHEVLYEEADPEDVGW